ncbi:MAG: hypothetical protein BJ554DRAFT_3526 [Olpidium bornovanus]|uniref:Uncharacterized protein n=1 Tax=Olpidium bornovanus TaxID=278681 RepID=A0A8H8DFS2_9FUNG|nr:MAG: hypothetical protein BJ554DRAFT_3526 [Olpidium bornovanus]
MRFCLRSLQTRTLTRSPFSHSCSSDKKSLWKRSAT